MKTIIVCLAVLEVALILFFAVAFLCGCAAEPMTFEQRQALMAMSNGLRTFGDSMQRSCQYQQQYIPLYTPTASFPPLNLAPPPPVQPIPQTINTFHGY